MSPRLTHPHHRPRWASAAVFALLLLTAACNEDGVQHPSPILDWKRVGVTPTAASAGDTVTVDWDYKNATKLKRQSFKLIRLSLAGLTTEEQALPRAQRAISFPFDGPVTVVITATDTANRQIDAAFDVKLDSDNHFRMGGVTQTHPGFPRLGQRKVGDIIINGVHHANVDPTPFDIEFTHFFGIYEVPDANGAEDGHIDDIPAELLQALPPTREFFGRSFDVRENVVRPRERRPAVQVPYGIGLPVPRCGLPAHRRGRAVRRRAHPLRRGRLRGQGRLRRVR